MRNETWVISEPRTLRTTIVANAADAAAVDPTTGFGAGDGPISSVAVSLMAGSVKVEAHDRLDIELDVVAVTGRPLVANLRGDQFTVSYDYLGVEGVVDRVRSISDKDSASIVLRVPTAATVKVSTVHADVNVSGVSAAVTVNTIDGVAEVDAVTGALAVTTAAGRVSATDHTGSAKVNTGAGDIHLAGNLGRVEVNTVSGEVVIVVGSGASKVSVNAVSSKVSLQAPAGTGVDFQARTVAAKVYFDGTLLSNRKVPVKTEHSQPGAAVFFSASTVAGDIVVSHQAGTN